MGKKISELDPEDRQSILNMISDQARESFDKIVKTDKWLTQHNFLVNAGGATATLAYMGANPTSTFALLPLFIYLIGIIASGIEIRGLLSIYTHLQKDALRRRDAFASDKLSAHEAASVEAVPKLAAYANHWSGIVSQSSFVLGSAVGILRYVYLYY